MHFTCIFSPLTANLETGLMRFATMRSQTSKGGDRNDPGICEEQVASSRNKTA